MLVRSSKAALPLAPAAARVMASSSLDASRSIQSFFVSGSCAVSSSSWSGSRVFRIDGERFEIDLLLVRVSIGLGRLLDDWDGGWVGDEFVGLFA